MEVTVKLFAMLASHAPADRRSGEPFEMTLEEGATIADLIEKLGIPERETKIAYVDGRARAKTYRLEDGAEVGIFPPVGGG